MPVSVTGSGSGSVNLGVGVLHINKTIKTATTVTHRSIWFQSSLLGLGDIVVSEAKAGFTGIPCT